MFYVYAFNLLLALMALSTQTVAGPYAPAANQPGTTAVSKNDVGITQWATDFVDYSPGAGVDAEFRTPEKALGVAVGDSHDIVSLGDKGSITLTFDGTIKNGPGWDFAIFENGFSHSFLELAFVEVSSDGSLFVPFPAFSFTSSPVAGFGAIDPTNIDGFAGKYIQGFGTPFDLDLFGGFVSEHFDSTAITHVRLIDVKGDGSEFDDLPAEFGGPNPIYDPFPTTGSAGFDLDAIGVRYFEAATVNVPVPAAAMLLLVPALLLGRGRRS